MKYYLSAQDFIYENKNKSVNIVISITHKITKKMRLEYPGISKDNKFYFYKNDQFY
jgi:hypothetical protein